MSKSEKSILSYVVGLPTPLSELNALGMTNFESFLTEYAAIYRKIVCETVNHLIWCFGLYCPEIKKWLTFCDFNKSEWNTYLQHQYQINKRHANSIISDAIGMVKSAEECKQEHIKTLLGKLKSAKKWLAKKIKLLKDVNKFYAKSKKVNGKKILIWKDSKTGCRMPLACSLKYKNTNLNHLRFLVHNKKRYITSLLSNIEKLKVTPLTVKVPHNQVFFVGSKDESFGNQVAQWDGSNLTIRVPYCLEKTYGEYVTVQLGSFDRNINRLPEYGAKTWSVYKKDGKWKVCIQFQPITVTPLSNNRNNGVISFDLNPSSIDWAEIDRNGNAIKWGSISLQIRLPKNQMENQLQTVALFLVKLSLKTGKSIVHEKIDFVSKKFRLRESGNKKYNRMLSAFAYSKFFQILNSIAGNRGVSTFWVNPQYTSLLGMTKFMRRYLISCT
jgi:IS605 OrfB family transposase